MVTVVKKDPHPSVVKELICRHCGATLQYTPSDLKSYKHCDYGGGCDVYYFINCPSCDTKINVNKY